jgi:hypothetical protein
MILWAAGVQGPTAPPGAYQVRVAVNGRSIGTQRFRLVADPRLRGVVTQADHAAQFRFLQRVATRFGEANDAVKTIRFVRSEVEDRRGRLNGETRAEFDQHAAPMGGELASVEDSVYQTRSRSNQDPLNYPIRINNKLAALMGMVGGADGRPTAQAVEVFGRLDAQLDRELGRMRAAFLTHLPRVNSTLRAAGLPEIVPRAVDVAVPARMAPVP